MPLGKGARTLAALAAVLLSVAVPAFAQLSPVDIEKLKEEVRNKGYHFTVSDNPATRQPVDQLCGLRPPPDWQATARYETQSISIQAQTLPSKFDWRDYGAVTPVRNQAQCGACWAFATVGVTESAIKRATGLSVDLSEQWLVSCTSPSNSCNGGWFAYEYYKNSPSNPNDGAVLESAFPYQASDVPCGGPYAHPYFIHSWANVSVPSVQSIKEAIFNRGPVGCAIYAGGPLFMAYSGGVFDANESGVIDHAVVLVGWDDNQGQGGVWFLKNSWNTWWGEAGYMRIGYGKNLVGTQPNYVTYSATPAGSLFGYVRNSGGQGVSGATVTATPGPFTATTVADGSYRMDNVTPRSNYSVQATKTGYTSHTVNNVPVTANICSTQDFTLAASNGSITGRVTSAGLGLGAATVSISPTGLSAATDSQGYYTIPNVPPNTYSVTASKLGYQYVTASGIQVTAGGAANVNFTLTQLPVITPAQARSSVDGAVVRVAGKISAKFADCFYVAEGAAGIRAAAPTTRAEGSSVVVTGTLVTLNGERCLAGPVVE